MRNPKLCRRKLLNNIALLYGSSLAVPVMSRSFAETGKEPHYLLLIVNQGGMDDSYWFDARPLEMTQNNHIQNYFIGNSNYKADRSIWQGSNGGQTLVTSLVKNLQPFKEKLAIFNGVQMATTFDGHDQNLNYLLTGNPFGGDAFIPTLATLGSSQGSLLDYLQTGAGFTLAEISNFGGGINMPLDTAKSLIENIKNTGELNLNNPIASHIRTQMTSLAKKGGLLGKGSQKLNEGMLKSSSIANKLKRIDFDSNPNDDGDYEFIEELKLITQSFTSGLTNCGIISSLGNFDAHATTTAQSQPQAFEDSIQQIKQTLQFLQSTPSPTGGGKSMLDVTTVMISSEFGRTMRQRGQAIRVSGTDHNPLSNTVLMAGKGIKGNIVVGSSDFESSNAKISGAHKELERSDKDFIKIMGRPFDFANQRSIKAYPDKYNAEDYLKFSNIVNSLFRMFGVPEEKHWKVTRNSPAAKTLNKYIG